MLSNLSLEKIKVRTVRDIIFILVIFSLLILFGLNNNWAENFIKYLDKNDQKPYDDILVSILLTSTLFFVYAYRRDWENKLIIDRQKETEYDLQKTQDYLQVLLNSSSSILFNCDANDDFKSLFVSDNITSIIGYQKEEFFVHMWWRNNIHPEDQHYVRAELDTLLQTGFRSFDFRFKHSNGQWIWMRVDCNLLYLQNGEPCNVVGTWWDISILKQTEAALRVAKEKAEESVRFKSEFLANMSHEIRTPLNGIVGMTELALDTDIDAQQKRYLDNIKTSSETLLSLINDILDFSKIDAGKLELSPVNFSLRDEISQSLQVLGFKSSTKKIEFIFQLQNDVPDLFIADVLRLQQIIVNLAGNAIKFTEEGEIIVKVEMKSKDEDFAELLFSVSDTGIGIDEDKIQTIFQEFIQGDGSTTRKYGGTGLGLTITKKLVNLLGGEIWVESKKGKGSTFFFTVKMKLQNVDNQPRIIDHPELDGTRVLIVEENRSSRHYITELVTQFRLNAFAVNNGEDAVEALQKAAQEKRPYSLVLLGMALAGKLDGFDVAERIQNNAALKQTEIIVISNSYKASDREAFAQIGIKSFFTKPFSPSDLLDTIYDAVILNRLIPQPAATTNIDLKPAIVPANDSLKILIVEDNQINQEVAYNMLLKIGMKVIIANNGKEAVDAVATEAFDLVFMDVQMPLMNGYEATEKIRQMESFTDRHTPIIGLTANAMVGDKEKCLAIGMDDYVSKPIKRSDIVSAIKRVTGITFSDKAKEAKMNNKPLINPASMLERLDGDTEIFEGFMAGFTAQALETLQLLLDAGESQAGADIVYSSHKLRGLCLNLEIYKVTELTVKIETLVHNKQIDQVQPYINAVETELKLALEELEKMDILNLQAG